MEGYMSSPRSTVWCFRFRVILGGSTAKNKSYIQQVQ